MRFTIKKPLRVPLPGLLLALAVGCGRPSAAARPAGGAPPAPSAPAVAVVKPERHTLGRTVEQPGTVEAFEEAPLVAKIAGYVREVNVDIGDRVRKGDVLAELWVPEMEEEVKQKKALVTQAEAEVAQAEAALKAAEAGIETAAAQVQEAEAGRKRAQANYERWRSEYRGVE